MNLAFFGLFFVTSKMIENWGSVRGRRVLDPYVKNFVEHGTLSLGNGPNTVSGSTVSNTELSEFFRAH